MFFGLFFIIFYFLDIMIINGCFVYIVFFVFIVWIYLLMNVNLMLFREVMKIINKKRFKVSRIV